MADLNDLAQLEAERQRLLSMIAYHNPPLHPPWFRGAMVGALSGTGIIIVVAILSGQDSLSGLIFSVVVLSLSAYILTRKVTLFGMPISVFEIVTLSPSRRPAGEPEVRQRLADCEARITKLKESHS